MTPRSLIATLLISLSAAAGLAAGIHDHSPKFGGIVVESKAGDLEIVVRPDVIRIHVSDHGKPVDLQGASAKVTLLSASGKTEVTLAPSADALQAQGRFIAAAGTKGIAVVTLAGKPPATARFEIR